MKAGRMLIALTLVLAMLIGLGVSTAAETIKINVDGKQISADAAPIIENGRTLVPARAIFEALGAKVDWNAARQEVTVTTAAADVKLTINSRTATVNGAARTLDVAAKIIDSRTYVPLRFIAEAIGAEVEWDSATSTVKVNYFSKMTGTLKLGGSTTVQPLAQEIADVLIKMNSGLSVTIAGTGSGDGVKGAGSGQYNIGNVSREVTDAEKTEYADLKDFQVASDGIAVIVHKDNKVKALTKDQVYKIFTGQIVNWAEVGGDSAPIFVQTREEGSGTLGAFLELAIQPSNSEGQIIQTAIPHTSNGLVKEAVAKEKNAIGFLSFGYLDSSITAVSVEGVAATEQNAISGRFPFVRPLVVCTKGRPAIGSNTAKFIDYYTSTEGKAIVGKNYIAIQ